MIVGKLHRLPETIGSIPAAEAEAREHRSLNGPLTGFYIGVLKKS